MSNIPIKRMILYKHGVGYFERRGSFAGTALQLQFARESMDDILKSLVVLDLGAGQVLGIDFETPEDRTARLARGSIHLSENRSLLDLLRDLRGREVRLTLQAESDEDEAKSYTGLVVGVDVEHEQALRRPLVTLFVPNGGMLHSFPIHMLRTVSLIDSAAAADLSYFLRASQSEEERRSATVHLSPGDHEMLVGYIAPAPSWRVSYRMLFEANDSGSSVVLLQGWGLFDNQLEEDLEGVELTLVAGMPISFRYRLYEPHTPQRPLIEDEERTVSAPVFFESAPPPAPAPMSRMALGSAAGAAMAPSAPPSLKVADMAESVQAAASGEERGALFAYNVAHPVSVARGQSAMVPILSQRLACKRDLLYNGAKLPKHPVASLRLNNETGLTLERGPVTVLEEGDYAGEAVLPFTRTGGELIVPFAVELGIDVDEQYRSERQLASISVRDQFLLVQEYDVQRRIYHLTSTLSDETTVMVEHQLLPNYELWQVRDPDERTASVARWNVICAPHSRTVFEVVERQMQSRREQVRGLTGNRLRAFLRDKFLDETTFAALEAILSLYANADEAQARINAIDNERKQIYAQQKQIQGSLGPLGREGDEGALRQRYVVQLNRLEDQLNTLASEETRLKERIAALEQEAADQIRALAS